MVPHPTHACRRGQPHDPFGHRQPTAPAGRRLERAAGRNQGKALRCRRGLRLCSRELGLFGVADVVEFHPVDSATSPRSAKTTANGRLGSNLGRSLPGVLGRPGLPRWKPPSYSAIASFPSLPRPGPRHRIGCCASRIASGAAKPAPGALLSPGRSFLVILVLLGVPGGKGLPTGVFRDCRASGGGRRRSQRSCPEFRRYSGTRQMAHGDRIRGGRLRYILKRGCEGRVKPCWVTGWGLAMEGAVMG